MAHPAVDKFGKIVVTKLRDNAIDFFDLASQGHWRAPSLQNLQRELADQTPEQIDLIRRCVIQAIETGMHDFLFALVEANDFENVHVMVDGVNVADESDGLHGEQFTEEGWIAKFAKHPEGSP
ncbi:hypothetical protein [Adhaeretor mobilis]|uniref:Uncharacterized protein n=1 Tax=Adhaeretor mobilis TaxID=1930276 RepID=A0A517N2H2_9BACT|nr:hypothetical protein [Adhaeretor mobilis]QDT01339.1 hypothetical protein HG15A2_46810 [Adhaeretor mobilis]